MLFVALLVASVGAADITKHLGNLSPYFDAPVPAGISTSLPAGCSVNQVMLMHRHGSRFPLASELTSVTGLVAKLANASAVLSSSKTHLPSTLAFLSNGYTSTLGHDDLTAVGRRELFDSGVSLRLKYPALATSALPINVLAGAQDRVIESAQWFQQGFFGRFANVTSTFSTIPEDTKTISWITPFDTCPKWQYAYGANACAWGIHYIPAITARLNRALASALHSSTALVLTDDNVHGALYACAYDLAALGSLAASPWCGVFSDTEINAFEYELDLLMNGAFGYGLPSPMGPLLGTLFAQKLVERFSNNTGSAVPLYLEFGHDTTIDIAMTTLGLAKDTLNADVSVPPANRKWRTSYQVPFAARMVWEKFTCQTATNGFPAATPQIRLLLNNAPVPLSPICSTNRAYGSCSLADFVGSKTVKAATSQTWGDASWNATCGNPMI